MTTVNLYKYAAENGEVVSTAQPAGEYTVMYRLIADEGKTLTDGAVTAAVIDVYSADGWTEIDAPEGEDSMMSGKQL